MAKAGIKRIVVKREDVRKLMLSPDVTRDLARRAQAIGRAADALTPGARHNVYVNNQPAGNRRSRAAIVTGNREARLAQWKHGTLLHALNAGRDQ